MKSFVKITLFFSLVLLLFMTQLSKPATASHIQLAQSGSVISTILTSPSNPAFVKLSSVLRRLRGSKLFRSGERAVIKGEKSVIESDGFVATRQSKMRKKETVAAENGLEIEGKIIENNRGNVGFGVGRVKISSAALNDAMNHTHNLLALGVSVELAKQLYESYNIYKEVRADAGNPVDPCKPLLIHPDGSDRTFSIYDSESCSSAEDME